MNATTASQQKSLSYKIANFSRTVWEESAVKIVSTGVKAKFEQNDKCKVFLLSTKNKEIMEASQTDKFWGVGRGLRDPQLWNKNSRQGKNHMGKILMEVRNSLA